MKKTTSAAFATLAALAFAGAAFGTMDDQKAMKEAYKDVTGLKVNCGTCHAAAMPKKGSADANVYGKDWAAAKKDFKAIEAKDSDGDGKSNLDEIKAGTNPGAK